MNYYLLIALLLSIVLIIILYLQNKKRLKVLERVVIEKHDLEVLRKDELKNYFEDEWQKEKEKIDYERRVHESDVTNQIIRLENKYKLDASTYKGQIKQLDVKLQEKEKRYNEVNQDLDLYREGKMKEIDGMAAEYEQRKRQIVDSSIDKYRDFQLTNANNKMALTKEEIDKASEELNQILQTLEEERTKRAVINEEIRKRREVEEKQDFYKIQFSDEDRNDVEILRSVAPRLRHPEAINKVIWSAYYQKPLAELRKRVAIEGSGIYKITRIKTGEIYIGQARNVSTRFAEHCKAALGVGTLASSQLHRAMQSDGCENFLFELLEETPVEKLKERESYYIDFYDSKNYGLNAIRGEQK